MNMHAAIRFAAGRWYRVALFNFWIVATVGVLLRLKLLTSLPWLAFKPWLFGHAFFAFGGWVSLALMTAVFERTLEAAGPAAIHRANKLLLVHTLLAWIQLFSFGWQGYGPVSIAAVLAAQLIYYAFAVMVWPRLDAAHWGGAGHIAIRWALVYLLLASAGTISLAWLMASHAVQQRLYFIAFYFFLHFQYNGWFFFGCVALWLSRYRELPGTDQASMRQGIQLMALACLPALVLSALWLPLGTGWTVLGVAAAALQWIAFALMARHSGSWIKPVRQTVLRPVRWLWGLALVALILRLLLQLLSTIPALSKYAFAYRPVVIGYLHLILLGCISFFLLGFILIRNESKPLKQAPIRSVYGLIAGVLITELTLMLQGMGYIGWVSIPYTPQVLFGAALLMWASVGVLWLQAPRTPRRYG